MVNYFLSTSAQAIYANRQPFTAQVEADLKADIDCLEDIYRDYRKRKGLPDTIPTMLKFICWVGISWAFLRDIVYQAAILNKTGEVLSLRVPEKVRPRLLGLVSTYKEAYFSMVDAKYSSRFGKAIFDIKFCLLIFVLCLAIAKKIKKGG